MQQLVQFVATIFLELLLLILDEPFTGLDPINTNIMKKEILALKEKGCTIIFSTHRMEQVEEICENIALIDKGKILLNGKITEIKNKFKKNIYKIEYLNNFQVNDLEIELLEKLDENSILIKNNFADKSPSHLLKRLISQSEIKSFIEILPSLNEIFIESVQKKDVSNLENGE
jgi:ABC-2 type transport system ATP-binding protein